jgi:hypothetical protein
MDIVGQATTLLHKIGDLANVFNKAKGSYQTISLAEVTKIARVEPLTIISKDCLQLEYLPDVLQSMVNIFTGYYLQAIALQTKIDNVNIRKVLDRLNPDRDFLMPSFESFKDIQTISIENYKFKLPKPGMEAFEVSESSKLERELPDPAFSTGDASKDSYKVLSEMTNLAVGKMIEVTIQSGEQKVKIPVKINLAPAQLTNQSIVHILALKTEDNSIVERFHKWRSGRIDFIKDLIFCQDLIDEHKRALMKDEGGVYTEIIKRANNAKKFGALTVNPSLVSASNIFVISETVAREVEQKLGGKLSNPRVRQLAFENTYAMIIAVIDRDFERVTFYHRGIAAPTDVSIRDIKSSNKTKGPDIMDVLKSLNVGNAPSF